jgi:hypothetical protein
MERVEQESEWTDRIENATTLDELDRILELASEERHALDVEEQRLFNARYAKYEQIPAADKTKPALSVVPIREHSNDSGHITVRELLQDAIKYIDENPESIAGRSRKALIIFLDDTEGNYDTRFSQAGMRMSECVTLCEVAKYPFLEKMRYINTQEGY